MTNNRTYLSLLLFRPPIALMTALSALAGYALQPSTHPAATGLGVFVGVALLSAGCSALNQVQERDVDARMERTRHRPIASGRLSPGAGTSLAFVVILPALALLWRSGTPVTLLLGLLALVWYNGVYTPLKRRTPFALLPGAICGALPPLIGWTAAGGNLADYRIVLLTALLVLWQIPHFWFFALRHRADFLRSGLPTVFDRFTPCQVRRLALAWVFGLGCASLLLPAFGLLQNPAARLIAAAVALALAAGAAWRLFPFRPEASVPVDPFGRLNVALLLILATLVVEGLC